jgi:DNA-binding GntR family transcriptional regulator
MEPLSLSDFDRLPLHKLVYQKLRDSIISGGMPPGEKLIENDISRQLQISKTPIREAIRELSQEGLIVHTTRRGIHVIDFNHKDIDEIISLRAELESLGFVRASGNLSDQDFAFLESLLLRLAECEQNRQYVEMAQVDMEFHELIMKKSDNSRLLKAWKTIASQMQVLLNSIDFYSLSSDYAQKNHLQILHILRHPEEGDIAQTIKEHILTSRTLIFAQVK